MGRLDRSFTASAALVIAVFGFLPIANWIAGGPAIPSWGDLFGGWWSGTVLVLGVAVAGGVLTRRMESIPAEDLPRRVVERYRAAPWAWTLCISLTALLIYGWIARSVFSAKPLLIDEIVQVFQGRIYASGDLSIPSPRYPEFFSSLNMLNLDGKVFSQFPAGGPAMLGLGTLIGAEWVVGPLFGAASVVLFAALVRRIEERAGVVLAATLLFAFAPFVAFMAGSHMNHVTGLTWLLAGMLGLALSLEDSVSRLRRGLLLGVGFGVAATIRPLDAAAFAVPAGLWLLARSIRQRSFGALIGAAVGIAAPLMVQLWINSRTTGDPWLFGYNANYGAAQQLGFHATPWGDLHTPARGLELLNLYFVRLQSYLFELPVPSLLPALGALILARRVSAFDRYWLAASGLVAGLYFAYWHDGFFLGPRFLFPLAPFFALWTARFFVELRERAPSRVVARGLGFAVLASLAIAPGLIALRARQYRGGMLTMRWDGDGAARRSEVSHALVFVRESWGAQLIARMWAAGVSAPDAEYLYRRSDACALEQAVDRIEGGGLRGPSAVAELQPLVRDSARLVISPFTEDHTNRYLPGSPYAAECLKRLRQDREGFTLLSPLLLAGAADVIYARDLQAHDSLLVQEHPDRSLYLLRPATAAEGAIPRFYPVRRDSLFAAWRAGE